MEDDFKRDKICRVLQIYTKLTEGYIVNKAEEAALYEVNETGLYIWNQIDGCREIEDIASLLKAAIIDDVDYQVLLHDVAEFVDYLINKQFLEVLSCG